MRGGISQFNKISRFVDMPNILSKLELRDITRPRIHELRQRGSEETGTLYDKKQLLERIIDFYK
jgi:hypothetical protein